MKKLIITASITLLLVNFSSAQKIMLEPFMGYTFKSNFNIQGGRASIEDGLTFGSSIVFMLNNAYGIDFTYVRQETSVRANSIFLTDGVFRSSVSVNYLLIGGRRFFPSASEDLHFWSGAKIGAVIFASPNDSYETITRFAANVSGGLNYFVSDHVGFNLGLRVGFPISDVGAGLGWDSNNGATVAVTSWSSIVQFGFTGGLSIRLD